MSEIETFVFISYSRADDEPFVQRLYADLIASGINVWWDRRAMESRGRTFLQEIRDAIENCDRLIAVIGPNASASEYVRYEWEYALLFAKGIVPILRQGGYEDLPSSVFSRHQLDLGVDFGKFHCPDFREQRPYDEALEELLRILQRPVPALARTHATPALPPHFLPRRNNLEALRGKILPDSERPVIVTLADQTTVIHGIGGVGKSVLAAAFSRSTWIRQAFGDGIVWLSAGCDANSVTLLSNMKRLGMALGDDPYRYVDETTARSHLSALLADSICLIIIDDAWDIEQVAPFRDVLGPRCKLLITSRDTGLATSLGAIGHSVDVLADDEALTLLSKWAAQDIQSLPHEAKEIIDECGNLPLAIAMIGAMVRDNPNRWEKALYRLHNADLEKLRRNFPNYEYPTLWQAIAASVDALDPDDREVYVKLAIFPYKTPIPEKVLTIFFEVDGYNEFDTQDVIDLLAQRSLVRRDCQGNIMLHDLQHDYVKRTCEDQIALHQQLVNAYRKKCPRCWTEGVDDHYFYQYLPYHLTEALEIGELQGLLFSFAWLQKKLEVLHAASTESGVDLLANDFDNALKKLNFKDQVYRSLTEVKTAILQSSHALESPALLAQQLLGRIVSVDAPEIEILRKEAIRWKGGPWLVPMHPTLASSGFLVRTFTGHREGITEIEVMPDESRIITGSLDMYDNLILFDLSTGRVLKTLSDSKLGEHARNWDEAGIIALAVCPDGKHILTGCEGDDFLKIWDIETGAVCCRLDAVGPVTDIATGPAGNTAVSVAGDLLCVWDISKQTLLRKFKGTIENKSAHAYSVSELLCVALTPDGAKAIVGDSDGNIIIWDLQTGTLIVKVEAHTNRVKALSLASNGRRLISGSWDNTLKIWAFPEMSLLGSVTDFDGSISSVAVSSDGTWCAVADYGGKVSICDIDAKKIVGEYSEHGGGITDIAILEKPDRVLSACFDMTVKLWNVDFSENTTYRNARKHNDRISSIVVSIDGRLAATASQSETTIRIWDIETGRSVKTLSGHTGGVLALLLLPGEKRLASGGHDGSLRIWDLQKGKELIRLEGHVQGVTSLVSIDSDGSKIVSGGWDGRILIWNIKKGQLSGELRSQNVDQSWRWPAAAVRPLAFQPEQSRLLVGTEDVVEIWDLEVVRRLDTYHATRPSFREEPFVRALAVFPDGCVASASSDGMVLIKDPASKQKNYFKDRKCVIYPADCYDLAVSADGRFLLLATANQTLRVHDLNRHGSSTATFVANTEMTACACTPDFRLIAAGDAMGNIHFLNYRAEDRQPGNQ